jgi:hypothetical protein
VEEQTERRDRNRDGKPSCVDTLFFDTRETRFVIVLILQDMDGVSSEAGFACAEGGIVVMMMAINLSNVW